MGGEGAIEGHQQKEVKQNERDLEECVAAAHKKLAREVGLSSIEVEVLGKFSDDLQTDVTIPPAAKRVHFTPVKRVHFIRHGEGHHNVAQREWRASKDYVEGTEPYTIDTDVDYKYLDAELTDKGTRQAKQLQDYVSRNCNHTQLLIVSPLRRATQTGLHAFEQVAVPRVVALEAAHERAGRHTCDKRLSKTELQKLFGDRVDYELIEDEEDPFFWELGAKGDMRGRVRESPRSMTLRAVDLLKFIMECPETEIAVAAHSALLQAVFTCVLQGSDIGATWFGTGEIRSCDLTFLEAKACSKGYGRRRGWIMALGLAVVATAVPKVLSLTNSMRQKN